MDIQILVNVTTKGGYMKLTKQEMKNITGGGISYSLINAITKVINTIYELGQNTGSALRRVIKKAYCPIK